MSMNCTIIGGKYNKIISLILSLPQAGLHPCKVTKARISNHNVKEVCAELTAVALLYIFCGKVTQVCFPTALPNQTLGGLVIQYQFTFYLNILSYLYLGT